MSISPRALETMIDLVEIKLSCFEVYDREDSRELSNLEACLNELRGLSSQKAQPDSPIVAFPQRTRGRPRTARAAAAG